MLCCSQLLKEIARSANAHARLGRGVHCHRFGPRMQMHALEAESMDGSSFGVTSRTRTSTREPRYHQPNRPRPLRRELCEADTGLPGCAVEVEVRSRRGSHWIIVLSAPTEYGSSVYRLSPAPPLRCGLGRTGPDPPLATSPQLRHTTSYGGRPAIALASIRRSDGGIGWDCWLLGAQTNIGVRSR